MKILSIDTTFKNVVMILQSFVKSIYIGSLAKLELVNHINMMSYVQNMEKIISI